VEATPHGEIAMNKIIISAIALAATASIAFAADDSSLTTKAMKDQPGTMGGSTDMPTAKPDSGSLSEKAMKDQPGTK
jgi:inosine/xanthosine triphosphate pyrophosphatase family protein